jgi:hypothetical protein
MADYRQIHTHIWKDGWFLDLPADDKLLFIYLFSNERASVAGIYELAARVMSFETGLEPAVITRTLARFSQAGKVHYENGIVWVVNMRKYNANPSPRVHDRICADLAKIADCPLKRRYVAFFDPIQAVPYRPDTLPIPYQPVSTEQEQEQEQEHTPGADAPKGDPVKELAAVFEQAAGITMPQPSTEKGRKQAGALWWNPLREMVRTANGSAPDLLRRAVQKMRADHLTIAAPNSVSKVFASLHGEAVTGPVQAASRTPAL